MSTKSTYGLRYEQLMKLLCAGAANSVAREERDVQAFAARIQSYLDDPLHGDSLLAHVLRSAMELMGVSGSLAGRSVCEVLLDAQSPMALLGAVKLAGKQMSHTDLDETEHAVGVIVYHGALAAAMVYHNKKITQSGWKKIGQGFATLADKGWMPPHLSHLFRQAGDLCQQKEDQ